MSGEDGGRADDETVSVEGVTRAALWALWSVRGASHEALQQVLHRVDPAELWSRPRDSVEQLLDRCGFAPAARERAAAETSAAEEPATAYRRELEAMPEDARLLYIGDPDYPDRLLDLTAPPMFLYVRGAVAALDAPRTLAVVGSRRIDVADARRSSTLVGKVASKDVVIVSGGAQGADAVAHRASMNAGTPTAVVLPSGLDEPTPASNRELFNRAATEGVWLTEYPLGIEVRKYHFPRRNRLIAALGDATLVLRGGVDSGTMLTADAAGEIGRPVCALLGGLDEDLVAGCHSLVVEEGAQAVRDAGDVLHRGLPASASRDPGPTNGGEQPESASGRRRADRSDDRADDPGGDSDSGRLRLPNPEGLSDRASKIVKTVEDILDENSSNTLHVDAIARKVELPADEMQSVMLELELRGIAEKKPGAQSYFFETRPLA